MAGPAQTTVGLDRMHVGRDPMAACRLTFSCFDGYAPLYNFRVDWSRNLRVPMWHLACLGYYRLHHSNLFEDILLVYVEVVRYHRIFTSGKAICASLLATFSRNFSRDESALFIFWKILDESSKSATTHLVTATG